MIKTLCIFGTRPEAIKMAPVVKALNNHDAFQNYVCLTGQHQELITPLLEQLQIKADVTLSALIKNQNLSELTARIITGVSEIIAKIKPDMVLVHGDTTTTLAASLSSYYHHIPVAHVEAGLRTGNHYSPWPEEVNRKVTGVLSQLHFAPTKQAKNNLIKEGHASDTVFITGNTVIDSLYQACELIDQSPALQKKLKKGLDDKLGHAQIEHEKIILVTGHRRENFGQGFQQICNALKIIASQKPNYKIIYPVHLNPNVQKPVYELLSAHTNIHLIEPQDYLSFIYLMRQSDLILTDSGGIQEEAPSLGKPVLVMRENSERPEAIDAGTVKLVGTETNRIVEEVQALLENPQQYQAMSQATNPYGDGKASEHIVDVLLKKLSKNTENQTTELREFAE